MPKNIPVVPRSKTVLNLFKFLDNPIPIIDEAIKAHGDTYMIYLGGTLRNIMTTNPEVIKHILQKNNKNYPKSDLTKKGLGKYLGQGLLTSDGPYWLQQRRLIQPGFHRAKLAKLTDTMNDEITTYIDNLGKRIDAGDDIINVSNETMELTLNIVCKSLFGSEFEQEILDEFGELMHFIQEYLVKEIRTPIFQWWRKLNGENKVAQGKSQQINDIVLNFIKKRRAEGGEHDDLLDMLLHSKYEDTGEGMNDQQLLDEALILFVAGHETSAVSAAWTLLLLSQHDHHRQSLADELGGMGANYIPGFEDIPRLDYSRQVVSEAMRIYPPAWIVDRLAIEDDVAGDFHIPKNTTIGAFIYGVHHSEELWNEPSKFDPSRFSKENMKSIKPFSYFPFGGGPRLCIGQHFAMMEMQLIISRLSQSFKFTLVNDTVPEVYPLVTLRPKEDIIMKVERMIK